MGGIALGVGIWYLTNSIGGGSITYTSLDNFLGAVGVQNGDIATANGCFLCGYVEKLFGVIGTAAESFWIAMLDNLWILLAIGFGVFLFITTAQYFYDASKKNATLDDSEKKLELKPWFDKVWKQGARVMMVGAFLGAIGFGGTTVLKTVANITITPVMFAGAELSMAATGISDSAQCGTTQLQETGNDVLNPVMRPFMCVMGNLNSVMLAGASGGFALMNYSWMGMGGGMFTWVAGLALVIMFLIIGFGLFFEVLSVVFQLVFVIIFLPIIIAFGAFEGTWKLAGGIVSNSINILCKAAISIVRITLKILIVYATVSFAADEYFPGPNDGYNAILPAGIVGNGQMDKWTKGQTADNQTLSVMAVFSKCEKIAIAGGEMDKDKFKNCFTASKTEVERKYPGAFDFMKNGWEFLMLMSGLFFLYYYAVSPKIDELLGKSGKEKFDFGGWMKDVGKSVYNIPGKIGDIFIKAKGAKK
jgi:hypothetical protein